MSDGIVASTPADVWGDIHSCIPPVAAICHTTVGEGLASNYFPILAMS